VKIKILKIQNKEAIILISESEIEEDMEGIEEN